MEPAIGTPKSLVNYIYKYTTIENVPPLLTLNRDEASNLRFINNHVEMTNLE